MSKCDKHGVIIGYADCPVCTMRYNYINALRARRRDTARPRWVVSNPTPLNNLQALYAAGGGGHGAGPATGGNGGSGRVRYSARARSVGRSVTHDAIAATYAAAAGMAAWNALKLISIDDLETRAMEIKKQLEQKYPNLRIETVANGWIVHTHDPRRAFESAENTFVFTDAGDMAQWIKKNVAQPEA